MSAVLASATLFVGVGAHALDEDRYDSWYFTAAEIDAAYQYQEGYGARLRNPLRGRNCLFREEDFETRHGRNHFAVPCRFVLEITRHLREMIGVGAAKFLFPLDADHAHLGVPLDLWESKYKHLSAGEVLPALVREPRLVALYHTAEHLRVTDRKTGAMDKAAQSWQAKRNVVGFFDGRPIQILPPQPGGRGASMPEGYYSYSGFSFLASPRGELYLSSGTKVVSFDIALDGSAAEDLDDRYRYSSETRTSTRGTP